MNTNDQILFIAMSSIQFPVFLMAKAFLIIMTKQGIFCPSLGAEFQPYSQSKIATFFPNRRMAENGFAPHPL